MGKGEEYEEGMIKRERESKMRSEREMKRK